VFVFVESRFCLLFRFVLLLVIFTTISSVIRDVFSHIWNVLLSEIIEKLVFLLPVTISIN